MPPAAKGHQTLSAYISSRFDEFSRSQKDVAQYVVDHLDEAATDYYGYIFLREGEGEYLFFGPAGRSSSS